MCVCVGGGGCARARACVRASACECALTIVAMDKTLRFTNTLIIIILLLLCALFDRHNGMASPSSCNFKPTSGQTGHGGVAGVGLRWAEPVQFT